MRLWFPSPAAVAGAEGAACAPARLASVLRCCPTSAPLLLQGRAGLEFFEPPQCPFFDCPAGSSSPYAEQTEVLLRRCGAAPQQQRGWACIASRLPCNAGHTPCTHHSLGCPPIPPPCLRAAWWKRGAWTAAPMQGRCMPPLAPVFGGIEVCVCVCVCVCVAAAEWPPPICPLLLDLPAQACDASKERCVARHLIKAQCLSTSAAQTDPQRAFCAAMPAARCRRPLAPRMTRPTHLRGCRPS